VTAAETSLNKESVSVLCKAVTNGFMSDAESIKAIQMSGGRLKHCCI
jgi:flagellar basal body rod protein FlgF